jgi:hyperosmotically inducible protein
MNKSTCSLSIGLCLGFLTGTAIILDTVGCAGTRYTRSTGEYIDDHSLQMRVERALSDNPDYKFGDVAIATFKGTVQLNGFVDSLNQKNKAGEIVKQVQGVRDVDNNIMVEDNGQRTAGEAVDDKALASRVRDALHDNPAYKFDGVGVGVYRATVQLSGFVDTADQKTRAGDIARQGVKDVHNDIMVKDRMNR